MITVKQLKEAIDSLPDDMEILLESNPEEGLYGESQQVRTEKIKPEDEEGFKQKKRIFLVISDNIV